MRQQQRGGDEAHASDRCDGAKQREELVFPDREVEIGLGHLAPDRFEIALSVGELDLHRCAQIGLLALAEKRRDSGVRQQRRAGQAAEKVLIDRDAFGFAQPFAGIDGQRGFESVDQRVELIGERDLQGVRVAALGEIVETDEAEVDVFALAPAAGKDGRIGFGDAVDAEVKKIGGSGERRSMGEEKIGDCDRLEWRRKGERYGRQNGERDRRDLLERREREEEQGLAFQPVV